MAALALVSTVLIALQSTTRLLEPVESALMSVVTPLVVVAEMPYLVSNQVGNLVSTREGLLERNAELERRVLELSQISQQYMSLKAENERLRALLGSRARLPSEVLISEIIGVVPAPGTHQVVLDKGANDDVRVGDAVIDAEGLFGQVVDAGRFTSRVMLVTDPNHAVPVQVNRNGVRSIAGGTGQLDQLQLENVSVTADIREGDLLETSGLGGRFPPGFPVGYVDAVVIEPTAAFASVTVRPLARLDRSRHVLVVLSGADLELQETLDDTPIDDMGDDPALEGVEGLDDAGQAAGAGAEGAPHQQMPPAAPADGAEDAPPEAGGTAEPEVEP